MAVVRQAGRDIGEVVATMVNLINPSVVVIGGQVAGAGEHLLAGIRESVYQRSLPLATEHLRIVTSRAAARPPCWAPRRSPSSTSSPPTSSRPPARRSPLADAAARGLAQHAQRSL